MTNYTCETCKHYDPDEYYCQARGESEMYEEDSCDGWTDPDSPNEPTDEEKRENAGDIEAHRIMVEGREIG